MGTATGTKKDRPELGRMFDAMREGDTTIVCKLTRLIRSEKDLIGVPYTSAYITRAE